MNKHHHKGYLNLYQTVNMAMGATATEQTYLWRLHLGACAVHLANTLVVLITALQADRVFTLPVTWTKVDGAPGSYAVGPPETVCNMPLWVLCVVFSALAFIDHLYYVTIEYKYTARMSAPRGHSLMWYEYSYSATVMMVAIMLLCGVSDLGTLIITCALYWCAMRVPLLVEDIRATSSYQTVGVPASAARAPTDPSMFSTDSPFFIGCVMCVAPWIPVFVSLARASPPGFVYGIVVSLFVFFALFGAVQAAYVALGWSTFKRDVCLVVLSLSSKPALLWQVYVSALVMN